MTQNRNKTEFCTSRLTATGREQIIALYELMKPTAAIVRCVGVSQADVLRVIAELQQERRSNG